MTALSSQIVQQSQELPEMRDRMIQDLEKFLASAVDSTVRSWPIVARLCEPGSTGWKPVPQASGPAMR